MTYNVNKNKFTIEAITHAGNIGETTIFVINTYNFKKETYKAILVSFIISILAGLILFLFEIIYQKWRINQEE